MLYLNFDPFKKFHFVTRFMLTTCVNMYICGYKILVCKYEYSLSYLWLLLVSLCLSVSLCPSCPCRWTATPCPSAFCRRRAPWSTFTAWPAPAWCCCSWLTVCGWRVSCSASAWWCWGSPSTCELGEARPLQDRAMMTGGLDSPMWTRHFCLFLKYIYTQMRTHVYSVHVCVCVFNCTCTFGRLFLCGNDAPRLL